MASPPTTASKTPLTRRVRTPTVLQMEAVECGAAALAIVLAYHGRIVPLEEMRVACGVSRDGSKASNLLKASARYGLEAHGYSKEPDELRELKLPFIVFWNFNHFLVVEGFGKGVVYLNDPASGPRQVLNEEFDQSFTGVVLTFALEPNFEKGGRRRSLLGALKTRLAGSEMALAYVVLAGLALVLPGLIVPTFSKIFVDDFLIDGKRSWMVPLLAGMGVTALVRAALIALQENYLMRMQAKLAISTASKFFWHVLHLPVEFFTQRYGGEIGSRVPINDWVAHLLSGELATTMINLVMVVFFGILLLIYDRPLTFVGIAVALLNVAAFRYFSRRRMDASRRLQQDEGKLMGTSMNGLQMIETLKATGREADFFVRWSGYQSKVVNTQQKLALYDRYLAAVSGLLSGLNVVIVLALGGFKVMDGHWTIGRLVAFQTLMASFLQPFHALVNLGSTLQNVEGAMNRLDDVLQYARDPQVVASTSAAALADTSGPVKLNGCLELKNITFGYSRLDPPLIENFSLTLQPGQRVALIGGSGSGKSTIAKLVCGLYAPWSGEILFDGQPRLGLPRALLTNSLALVDQDIFLFEGSIQENLTLWDETIPEHQVVQAARDACIHEDIVARPGGYESLAAEGGSNFSGGQRQRLEIARALVGNPTLLVLDEATSALDPVTEGLIDDNLRRRGCTCLIVAHRLSTIRDCDEIVVLRFGQVVQRGTHDQLKSVEGPYAELIQAE
jgi:NHLM bacteriocin system ABC transporter peptidase/ATP-binding protein